MRVLIAGLISSKSYRSFSQAFSKIKAVARASALYVGVRADLTVGV